MTRLFDNAMLARRRSGGIPHYFDLVGLPCRVEQELLDRLAIVTMDPEDVLVLGAVSVGSVQRLCERFPRAQVTIADCATDMLDAMKDALPTALHARVQWVRQDLADLNFGARSYELVFSNLYMPMYDDLGAVFSSLHAVLRHDGCLHFSCLGPDSFGELRAAWSQSDPDNAFHTLLPPDMHDVGDALVHAGFREPVMDRENYTLTYSSPAALLRDLRQHGVGNGFAEQRKGLTGKRLWGRFVDALGQQRQEERVPLTVELVIGQAWRGQGMSQQRRPDGAVGISLEALAHKIRREHGEE